MILIILHIWCKIPNVSEKKGLFSLRENGKKNLPIVERINFHQLTKQKD